MREVPAMVKDPIIESALSVLMETSFQMNEKQEVLWVTSPYDIIKKELDAFHESVNMQQQAVTMGYNLLLWGNLPYRHYFNRDNRFVSFTPIPDFTQIVPIIVSGKVLGFMVNGTYCYPYEYTYAQLEYLKNLGGIYKNNFFQMSSVAGAGAKYSDSEAVPEVSGLDFQNEFVIAPSYLSTAARPWKNINIIEDALLLNRMDQSNYYRIFSVHVGGSVSSKSAIRTLNYYRNLFKKVRKVSYDAGGMSSRGANQEFEVIIPKTEKQGVEVTDVGGEVDVKAIKDLETQYNKLFAALKIQPSQIGFGEEQSNAIGETNGQSYDRRLARTCKMLVYSVEKAIRNFDYLYLRSRGFDVKYGDWGYGTVSLSVLEDQARAEVLTKAVENLKAVTDVFSSMQLENYNKEYIIKMVLGTPLSSTGIDVQEVLKVPENADTGLMAQPGLLGVPDEGGQQVLASFDFRGGYMRDVFDVMEHTKVMPKDFISTARTVFERVSDKKLISSVSHSKGVVPYAALDDMAYVMQEDIGVDVTGVVYYMDGQTDQIVSDLDKVAKGVSEMVTLDFGQTVLIPSDVRLTLRDFNTSGVRALNKAYINSRGELILTNKSDIATYLSMKKSGLFSCLVSRLVEVP
jgi:hypothetical protein